MEKKTYTKEQKQHAVNSLTEYSASEYKRVAEELETTTQNVRNWAKTLTHPTLGKLKTKKRTPKPTQQNSPKLHSKEAIQKYLYALEELEAEQAELEQLKTSIGDHKKILAKLEAELTEKEQVLLEKQLEAQKNAGL